MPHRHRAGQRLFVQLARNGCIAAIQVGVPGIGTLLIVQQIAHGKVTAIRNNDRIPLCCRVGPALQDYMPIVYLECGASPGICNCARALDSHNIAVICSGNLDSSFCANRCDAAFVQIQSAGNGDRKSVRRRVWNLNIRQQFDSRAGVAGIFERRHQRVCIHNRSS